MTFYERLLRFLLPGPQREIDMMLDAKRYFGIIPFDAISALCRNGLAKRSRVDDENGRMQHIQIEITDKGRAWLEDPK